MAGSRQRHPMARARRALLAVGTLARDWPIILRELDSRHGGPGIGA